MNLLKFTHTDSILVAFSGGKDSIVTLDMCVRSGLFKRIECFYMYLVRDLECVETHINYVVKKYGVKLHKIPHYSLASAYNYGLYMPHFNGAEQLNNIKLCDIENTIRLKTGIDWIAYGMRKSDSLERRGMLSNNGGLDYNVSKVYPLRNWLAEDIRRYMKLIKIPLPDLKMGKKMSGVSLLPENVLALAEHWPKDFEKIKRVFPFIEALVKREEFRRQHEEQNSEIRDRDMEQTADPEGSI